MKIYGIDNLSIRELQEETYAGGKFVIYSYCFSLLVVSFKRTSPIYFVKSTENAFLKGIRYTLITILLGWWGIPWGIIFSLGCLNRNIRGGKNVTDEVMQSIYARERTAVFEFET